MGGLSQFSSHGDNLFYLARVEAPGYPMQVLPTVPTIYNNLPANKIYEFPTYKLSKILDSAII